jgi:uncharacterized DUF497 family protein
MSFYDEFYDGVYVKAGRYFSWDEEKNRRNKKKHGISLKEACDVFDDPNLLEVFDSEHSIYEDEDRWNGIGLFQGVVIVFTVYTEEGDVTRMISARSAEPDEAEAYYEYISGTIGGN